MFSSYYYFKISFHTICMTDLLMILPPFKDFCAVSFCPPRIRVNLFQLNFWRVLQCLCSWFLMKRKSLVFLCTRLFFHLLNKYLVSSPTPSFLAYLPFLKIKRNWLTISQVLSVCGSLPFNFWIGESVLTKFDMNVILLNYIPTA
jgi:hypothetical protein